MIIYFFLSRVQHDRALVDLAGAALWHQSGDYAAAPDIWGGEGYDFFLCSFTSPFLLYAFRPRVISRVHGLCAEHARTQFNVIPYQHGQIGAGPKVGWQIVWRIGVESVESTVPGSTNNSYLCAAHISRRISGVCVCAFEYSVWWGQGIRTNVSAFSFAIYRILLCARVCACVWSYDKYLCDTCGANCVRACVRACERKHTLTWCIQLENAKLDCWHYYR